MSEERVAWIDAVRTCACTLVVLVHVNFYTRPPMGAWWPCGFLTAPLFSLAVPLFLIISGLFADRFAAAAHRRLTRLALPFLAWNAITAGVLAAAGHRYDAIELVSDLFTGTWHLYYVFALIQLLAIHFLIVRFVRRDRQPLLFVALAFSTVALYTLCDVLLWTSGGVSNGIEQVVEKPFCCWALFFYAGVWMSRRPYVAVGGRWFAFMAAIVVFSYVAYYREIRAEDAAFGYAPLKQVLATGLPFQIAGSVGFVAVLRALSRTDTGARLLALLAIPGRDTFGTYVCHITILVALFAAMVKAGLATGGWLEAPILAAVVFGASYAMVVASRRFAPSALDVLLFGGRRVTDSAQPS